MSVYRLDEHCFDNINYESFEVMYVIYFVNAGMYKTFEQGACKYCVAENTAGEYYS